MPAATLIPKTHAIVVIGTDFDRKIGSISSEVERNTATSVPAVIIPPAYRLAAAAEKPQREKRPAFLPCQNPLPRRSHFGRPGSVTSTCRSNFR